MSATTRDLATTTDPTWAKPGPGVWELDKSHFSPNASRIARDIMEHAIKHGVADGFDKMGSPLKTLESRFINGHMYMRQVNLVGSDKDLPTPPAPILWLASRVHPVYRARTKQAAHALDTRFWRSELERWQREWKPQLTETSLRLSKVAPDALSDDELADHVAEAVAHITHGATLHFRLHISDLGPIGRLLVRGRDWGLEPPELMSTLAGSSPSTSAPSRALDELRALVNDQPSPPTSLDQVRAISTHADSLLTDYLTEYGSRLTTGYDIQALTLNEMPGVVLASICAAPSGSADAESVGDASLTELRTRVPESDRADFDELVDDARKLYELRDENGPLTWQWPAGLVRRAVVEAAFRLVDAGRIGSTDEVFDLTADEIVAFLRGAATPDRAEIARRHEQRMTWSTMTAPEALGTVEDPPPLWTLPGPLAEQMEIVLAVLTLLESRPEETHTPTTDAVSGVGVGDEAYTGTARVVRDASDALDRLEPGDVLVAAYTVPTYNSVLAMAGAVVVEHGGILCHAAVIAREFGLAGVVGATGALTAIPDGATVEVDPKAGTVTIVDA